MGLPAGSGHARYGKKEGKKRCRRRKKLREGAEDEMATVKKVSVRAGRAARSNAGNFLLTQ